MANIYHTRPDSNFNLTETEYTIYRDGVEQITIHHPDPQQAYAMASALVLGLRVKELQIIDWDLMLEAQRMQRDRLHEEDKRSYP